MATFEELKSFNPSLYWDGVCREAIPHSQAATLQVGNPVTSSFTEAFLGGPHAPVVTPFDPTGNIPIGPSDSYPKPWRSASQKLQAASNGSLTGPFARMVKIPPNLRHLCVDSCMTPEQKLCGGADGGLFGRLGLGDGNQLGFRVQNWYHQDEGTYNTAYWNNQAGGGNGGPGDWPTWKEWWEDAHKVTIGAVWEDVPGSPVVEVEVAFEDIGPGDGGYFPGPGMSGVAPQSYDLLIAMVALAVLIRW